MEAVFQIVTTFSAGLLASLSPCVYPMIPITVGFLGQNGRVRDLLAFSFGQILTFVGLGVFAVEWGESLGFLSGSRVTDFVMGGVLLIFGVFSILNKTPNSFNSWNTKLQNLKFGAALPATAKSFGIGVTSGLVASPCSGPVLGSVLALVASQEQKLVGIGQMVSYGVGYNAVFLALGLGLQNVKSLPRAGRWMIVIHRISSALMIGGGLYFTARGLLP